MRLATLLLLLLSSCGATHSAVHDFLGADIARILETASRVETLRIDGSLESRKLTGERVGDYPILGLGPELEPAQIETLRDALFDTANWQFDIAKACEFMPGVDYRFIAGGEQVDVLLCFSCDEWGFLYRDRLRIEDNDRARRKLLELARASFPKDEVLHALK